MELHFAVFTCGTRLSALVSGLPHQIKSCLPRQPGWVPLAEYKPCLCVMSLELIGVFLEPEFPNTTGPGSSLLYPSQ